MRKSIILTAVMAIAMIMNLPAHSQQGYSIVYDLYYQLMLYPENGDSLIQNNQALFDSRFYSCLNTVQHRAQQAALQHNATCDNIIDPHARAQCEKNNEGAKLWSWTRQVRSACSGSILWSQTDIGWATSLGKRELDARMPGKYESTVRTMVPQWKSVFICE